MKQEIILPPYSPKMYIEEIRDADIADIPDSLEMGSLLN